MDKDKSVRKLVVVADDYGLCNSVNHGIEKAFREGIITEISLMVRGKAATGAFEFLKKENIKNVGIHLELSEGEIMHEADYNKLFREKSYTDISRLFRKEIELFERTLKQTPSHITAHKGIHGNFKLIQEVINYAKANNIPVRRPHVDLLDIKMEEGNYAAEIMMKRANLKVTDHLFAQVRGSDSVIIKQNFLHDLHTVQKGQTAEIQLHPGFLDQDLLESSSLNYERGRDLAIAIDKEFEVEIRNLGFKIVSYTGL